MFTFSQDYALTNSLLQTQWDLLVYENFVRFTLIEYRFTSPWQPQIKPIIVLVQLFDLDML